MTSTDPSAELSVPAGPRILILDPEEVRCRALVGLLGDLGRIFVAPDVEGLLGAAADAEAALVSGTLPARALDGLLERLAEAAPRIRPILVVPEGAAATGGGELVRASLRLRWPAPRWEVLPLVTAALDLARGTREGDKLLRDLRSSIDDLRETQQSLTHAEKLAALGRMAAGLAHEMNNPLQSVVGFTTLALESLEAGPLRKDLDLVLSNAARIQRVVRALTIFGRRARGSRTRLAVNPFVLAAIGEARRDTGIQDVMVDLSLADGLPEVEGNEANLIQALAAVIGNALQAVRGKGTFVQVETRRDGDAGVVVEVTDDGPGIDPGILPRIFEPFQTTRAPGEGAGLGLPVAYGVVRDDEGELDVQNRPGGGATFLIRLPAAVASLDLDRVPLPEREAVHVLVVDDEPLVRDVLSRVLGGSAVYEIHVRQAGSGEEALRLLEEAPADILFVDLRMPGMDGFDLVARVRARYGEVRIVVITGHVEIYRAKDALARGADEYITKPLHFNEVLMVLERMIARG